MLLRDGSEYTDKINESQNFKNQTDILKVNIPFLKKKKRRRKKLKKLKINNFSRIFQRSEVTGLSPRGLVRETPEGHSLRETFTLSSVSPLGTPSVSESKASIKVLSSLWQWEGKNKLY